MEELFFLYLSEEDMVKAGVKDMADCISVMEDVFRLICKGDYRMGGQNNCSHGIRVRFPKQSGMVDMPLDSPGRWFAAMPAYLGGEYHCFGIKTYGANQDNSMKDLPRSILMVQLLDVETGLPLAYMSANVLSAMRTGGVVGLYIKYFAYENPKKIAIIGPGVISRYSLDAAMCLCNSIESVSVYGRGEANRKKFKDYCEKKYPSITDYEDCNSIDQACKDADIIISSNSQSSDYEGYPLLPVEPLKKGACVIVNSALRINYSGIDEEKNVFAADDIRMYEEDRGIDAAPIQGCEKTSNTVKGIITEKIKSGEMVINLPDVVEKGERLWDESKVSFCVSGGIPLEDVAWAYRCYTNAQKKGVGVKNYLWHKSGL